MAPKDYGSGDVQSQATSWRVIAPNDATVLSKPPKALRVTQDGNLALRGWDDNIVVFAVLAGEILPFRPKSVMATNTTAAVVGLF